MINGKFLPVGTVVLLKNAEANELLMIDGYLISDGDNFFDYSGCEYPQGVINSSESLIFNHDDIKQIIFYGYLNKDYYDYNERLLNKQEMFILEVSKILSKSNNIEENIDII